MIYNDSDSDRKRHLLQQILLFIALSLLLVLTDTISITPKALTNTTELAPPSTNQTSLQNTTHQTIFQNQPKNAELQALLSTRLTTHQTTMSSHQATLIVSLNIINSLLGETIAIINLETRRYNQDSLHRLLKLVKRLNTEMDGVGERVLAEFTVVEHVQWMIQAEVEGMSDFLSELEPLIDT